MDDNDNYFRDFLEIAKNADEREESDSTKRAAKAAYGTFHELVECGFTRAEALELIKAILLSSTMGGRK